VTPIEHLLQIMRRLRDPAQGCPWDVAQTFATIVPYTIEEAFEVADAVEQDDMPALKDELGDLLLQVVFHCQMAHERGAFTFDDVAAAICDKMVRRHPHVFEPGAHTASGGDHAAWERRKTVERSARKAEDDRLPSALDDIPLALPALARALKLQKRAAAHGFDWPDADGVREKFLEELQELTDALGGSGAGAEHAIAEELGDLLFTCVNLARKLELDPEAVLRRANAKFERRFRRLEHLRHDAGPAAADTTTAEALDRLWRQVKAEETATKGQPTPGSAPIPGERP
jgi:MazG family protein